jgi:transcriptional regulator with XRE-family HTH domain
MDLAEFLQAEIDKPGMSVRKVAAQLGISASAVQKISNRKIRTMPELDTLQRIADNSGLTLPAVVEMAGAMLGDTEKYTQVARELELHPWIAEEWPRIKSMTKEEFKEAVDYIEWRKRNPLPRPNGGQSNP